MSPNRENWKRIPLREIGKVISGYAFKSAEFREGGVPVIKIKNIRHGYVDLSNAQCVDDARLSLDGKYHVKYGDILISLTGSHLTQPESVVGRVARYTIKNREALLNQRAGKVIVNGSASIDETFLFYVLSSEEKMMEIALKAQGAASQANVSPQDVESVLLDMPILDIQKKIASILLAYDSLIDINNRRIQILEETVQRIYRDLFVDYSNQEGVKFINSDLGRMPEGWEIVEVGQRFSTVLGGTPSRGKEEYWVGGNIPWINSGKVNEMRIIDESEFITDLGLRKSSTKLMPKRSTVIAITGATLGQVSMLETEVCANQSVVGVWDKEGLYNEYIFYKFCEIIESVILKAGGGAQQHINKEIVSAERIVIPPKTIINEFNRLVRPSCDLISNLLFKNKNLKTEKRILLPKLISGEIDIENMNIEKWGQFNGA